MGTSSSELQLERLFRKLEDSIVDVEFETERMATIAQNGLTLALFAKAGISLTEPQATLLNVVN